MVRSPSDSSEQRAIEPILIEALSKTLGVAIKQHKKLNLTTCAIEIDGYSGNPPIICEASAHVGKPKGGQINKVMKDAVKLLFIDTQLGIHRKILVFADEAARKPFIEGKKWQAQCLKQFGFETCVPSLSKEQLELVKRAQERQGQVMGRVDA